MLVAHPSGRETPTLRPEPPGDSANSGRPGRVVEELTEALTRQDASCGFPWTSRESRLTGLCVVWLLFGGARTTGVGVSTGEREKKRGSA